MDRKERTEKGAGHHGRTHDGPPTHVRLGGTSDTTPEEEVCALRNRRHPLKWTLPDGQGPQKCPGLRPAPSSSPRSGGVCVVRLTRVTSVVSAETKGESQEGWFGRWREKDRAVYPTPPLSP